MNTHWIRLDPVHLRSKRTERGVSFSTSPYDIPAAVRRVTDEAAGRVLFEFRYLDAGEPSSTAQAGEVTVWYGKFTRRIFQLSMPQSWVDSAESWLPRLIGELRSFQKREEPAASASLSMTEKVFHTAQAELLQPA